MNPSYKKLFNKFVNKLGDDSYDNYFLYNNTLYYKNIVKIELARIKNNIIYINFSLKIKKPILLLLKYCLNNNIKEDNIRFVLNLFSEKTKNDFYEYHYNNIFNLFELYTKKEIFYEFKKLNFDFVKSLTSYIKENDIFNIFKDFCNSDLVKHFTGKENKYDYKYFYNSIFLGVGWIIDDSEIRNSIINIDRKIKIQLMLKNK